jgi:tetratricopeptide (TPR) repeat protein
LSSNPKSLRGDIDNIVLMALRKEPSRRYSSVEQFSEDIRRHQAGLPVVARPLTLVYRIGKFTKRHQIPVALASFMMMLLIGFGVTEAIQSNRIAKERDQAKIERERAEKVSNFLTEIFRSANPQETQGKEPTARELLDKGAERVRTELHDQPEVRAKLLFTIANAYFSLGVAERYEPLAEEAVELYRQTLGNENEGTIQAILLLGVVKYGRGNLAAALDLRREAVAGHRKIYGESPQLVQSLNYLAVMAKHNGKQDEAWAAFAEGVEIARRILPAEDPRLQEIIADAAVYLAEIRNDFAQAEPLAREALALAQQIENTHLAESVWGYSGMGRVLKAAGRYDEAEPFLQRTLEIRRQVFKADDSTVATSLQLLGELYAEKQDYAKAEEFLSQTISIRRKFSNRGIVYSYRVLSRVKLEQDDLKEAEKLIREAIAVTERNPDGKRDVRLF